MEPPKKREIKALIFDMNGVLALDVELRKGSSSLKSFHAKMAKLLKVDLDTWIDAIDTPYVDSIEGKATEAKTVGIIAKHLGTKKSKLERTIIKVYKTLFEPNEEIYQYAFKKKKEGYKIAILSDQWHLSKKAIYEKSKMAKFDAVVTSCDVGMRKPDPKIYKLTLKKLKLKAKETIFIDNRDWNLKPAKKLGMKIVLFKNNKQAIKEIEKILENENKQNKK